MPCQAEGECGQVLRVSGTHRKPPPRELQTFLRGTGALIAAARTRRGLTQQAAAEQAETELRQWQRMEAGAYNLTLGTLLRVAQLLEVSPRELVPAGKWSAGSATPKKPAR